MFFRQIRVALRNLLAARLFTTLNILGLTGGMVTAVFILLWVQNELSFDTYHARAARIGHVVTHLSVSKEETWHWSTTPMMLAEHLKGFPEIEAVTRKGSDLNDMTIWLDGKKVKGEHGAYVDANWFDVFDYKFISGSAAQFKSGVRQVAMTAARAEVLFGHTDVAGKTIRIDTLDYVIAGVYRNNPANSSFQFDFILPLKAYWSNPANFRNDNNWGQFSYETYLVTRSGANRVKLSRQLTSLMSNLRLDDHGKPSKDTSLEVEPLAAMHFNKDIQNAAQSKGDYRTVYTFFGLAVVILLVACINYVNLTTARASVRSREVGVKKLLGAGSSHLFGQFMIESVITCLLALGISTGLVFLLMPAFNALTGRAFALTFTDPSWCYVLAGTTMLGIALTGIYPSVLLASFRPFEVLRGSLMLGTTSSGFRKSLVVVQFSVTIVFLIATLVVYQQMRFIREKELGYDRAHVFTFRLPEGADNTAFKTELLRESSIADASNAGQNIVQIGSSSSGSYDWEGRPKDFNPTVSQISVESNFNVMFKLKMADGQWFRANNRADQDNVVLNETAVKKLNLRKPVVGQWFQFRGIKGVVMGVVRDFHYKSLREKIQPLVLFQDQRWKGAMYVKSVPGQEEKAVKAAEKLWAKMVPDQVFSYNFLDDTYDRLYKDEQRTATLFNTFATVAVIISCMGLFGLATFTAERRTREIGIRKVSGASAGSIVALLSAGFVKLVIIAIVLASPIGYYLMQKWLQGFEYRIALSWLIFAGAGIAAVVIAMLTISYQSIRVALMNPVKSLKAE
ncbi:ABC transporter permease [Dyadobacter sandarakinus]|uniref:ABC transporter permease n=1 Tax=Dyadobacter sandarakinus TaxID=2747268 RepID=A0ABX7I6Z7_9BACT|nr:ABC transporter permease [Dyadobacter sandarakinus]QRR01877.1 ABC transporter permease [Dyadobacter sandarakinus]